MKEIKWSRNGCNITLLIGNHHKTIRRDTEEEIDEIEQMAFDAAVNKDADQYNSLIREVEPGRLLKEKVEEQLGRTDIITKTEEGKYVLPTGAPVDTFIAYKMLEFEEKGFPLNGLIQFATLLSLNPDYRVKSQLYKFIDKNGIIVTDAGYLVLYKAVRPRESVDSELVEFVAAKIPSIKKQKRPPKNFEVYEFIGEDEGETKIPVGSRYCIFDMARRTTPVDSDNYRHIGNLKDLYETIGAEMNAYYTDKHTRTMEIVLGTPVNIPRESCDSDPLIHCSSGLHAGSMDYIRWFANHRDRVLVVLVNPKNVVSVPEADKIRTCEYLPVSILEMNEDEAYEEIEGGYWEEDYLTEEIKEYTKSEPVNSNIMFSGKQTVKVLASRYNYLEQRTNK